MVFSTFNLSSDKSMDIDTEIRFAIATARADGMELLRFDIKREDDILKSFNATIRILKKMKLSGQIQFIATPSSFTNSDAEAEFLRNKYPQCLGNISIVSGNEAFVFVKL